jgi:hypothetical protein
MSTFLLVGRGHQPISPFGLGHKQAKKPKKYGANAPQLRAIRCYIDFCVMLCNETAFNPVQIWLSGFAAMCRSTTVGMASLLGNLARLMGIDVEQKVAELRR